MRELWVIGGCVLGLVVLLALLGGTFHSSAEQPAHAMEVAQLKADVAGARAEAERLRAELKAAQQKVADLERRLGGKGK